MPETVVFRFCHMTSRIVLAILSASIFLAFLGGCNPKPKENSYARRAYLEQESRKRQALSASRLDELGIHDILVDVDEYRSKDWERKPYEGVDEWVNRIQRHLELNRDALAIVKKELDDLDKMEMETAAEVSALVKRNDALAKLISSPLDKESRDTLEEKVVIEADFTIDLIRKGETLFSLAMKNYESASMVKDIAIWNQGWIRHPDEVLAGLAIVLFPEEAKEKQGKVVDEYIKKIRSIK
jgi:hypothetical protein